MHCNIFVFFFETTSNMSAKMPGYAWNDYQTQCGVLPDNSTLNFENKYQKNNKKSLSRVFVNY